MDEEETSHNHQPNASRIINDLLELQAPQRLLTQEEQGAIGEKLIKGASVEEASILMATQIKDRYYNVLKKLDDDEGMELLQVCNS